MRFQKEKKILNYFMIMDFPNKKDENWKFTDLNSIVSKNFKNITNNFEFKNEKKIDFIKDFEHNHIILVNGFLTSNDMKFEEKGKLK